MWIDLLTIITNSIGGLAPFIGPIYFRNKIQRKNFVPMASLIFQNVQTSYLYIIKIKENFHRLIFRLKF